MGNEAMILLIKLRTNWFVWCFSAFWCETKTIAPTENWRNGEEMPLGHCFEGEYLSTASNSWNYLLPNHSTHQTKLVERGELTHGESNLCELCLQCLHTCIIPRIGIFNGPTIEKPTFYICFSLFHFFSVRNPHKWLLSRESEFIC